MRIVGNCLITRDHSRSAAAWQMFIGWSVIITSTGASGAVTASWPDDPRWIDSDDVARRTAPSRAGPSAASWKLGKPSVAGFSVKVSEWQPLAATRRTSAAASSASQSAGSAIGMKRPG